MKTILVPTDFSPNAKVALEYAAGLAKKTNASLILMHSSELYEEKFVNHNSSIKEQNSLVVEEMFSKLNELSASVQTNYEVGIDVVLYKDQYITASILQAAGDKKADLIIMGTYGASGLRRTLLGSKAAAVINQSKLPVLTIPPTYKWTELKNIVLAVEDEFENVDIVRPLFDLAEIVNTQVTVVVFSEEDADAFELITHTKSIDFIKQKFNRNFKKVNTEAIHLVGHSFHNSVQQFISEKKIDMLAMITHKRSFLQNIFDSSMTQKMSYYSSIPLLSLHMPDENQSSGASRLLW
jgi:nucleotide-binding universal stress UspA family protein